MMNRAVSRRARPIAPTIIVFVAMCAMTLTFLYPLFFMLLNAMKTKQEYYRSQFSLPGSLYFGSFEAVITNFKIFSYFGNTLFITAVTTAMLVMFALIAGYAFGKLRFRGKRWAYLIILSTMFLPGQVSMIPAYVMFARVGLIDSFWSVILSYLAGGLPGAILLTRGAVMGIPGELIESSKIDGANYFQTLLRVVAPLSMSAIAIVIIFNFIGFWNDLLTPMLYLSQREKHTVMVALVGLVQRTGSQPTTQLAGLILSVLPAVAVYLVLQKYMIKGMMVGSIK